MIKSVEQNYTFPQIYNESKFDSGINCYLCHTWQDWARDFSMVLLIGKSRIIATVNTNFEKDIKFLSSNIYIYQDVSLIKDIVNNFRVVWRF